MQLANKKLNANYTFWPIIILAAFILLGNHYYSSDEGLTLNAAWQLQHGKTMYLDFIEYITPGSAYFVHFFWSLFHSSEYFIAKIFAILFWLISAIGLYLISCKFTQKKYILYFIIFFWLLLSRYYALINHNYFSSFAAIWLVYFVIISLEKQKKYLFFVSGLFSGLVFIFLQTKGLILFLATGLLIIFLLKNNLKTKIIYITLFSLGFLVTVSTLLFFWPIEVLWQNLFLYPWLSRYMNYSVSSTYIFYIAFLTILAMLIETIHQKKIIFWLLLIYQSGLYLSAMNSFELSHFLINSFLAAIFLGYYLENIFNYLNFKKYLRYYLSVIILLVCLSVSLTFIPYHLNNNIFTLDIWPRTQRSVVPISEIQNAKLIYAGPYLPNFYYELKKENPFSISVFYLCDNDCEKTVIKTIQQRQPEYALIDYQSSKHLHYDNYSLINQYFRNNYQYCFNYEKVSIYALDHCPLK